MQALNLPPLPLNTTPPFSFPNHPPPPSSLQHTTSRSIPTLPESPSEPHYLIRVLYTALTRGELTWKEILEPSRFTPTGSAIPGHDVIGTIQEVSFKQQDDMPQSKPRYRVGDTVWGLIDFDRDGAAADFTIVKESEIAMCPPAPDGKSDNDWLPILATLPLSGLTAYQALFDHSKDDLPTDHPTRVLVTGATGSVGILTLQIAKAAGYEVLALTSTRKADAVRDYATEVISYDDLSFTSLVMYFQQKNLQTVDLVVDCVGGDTLKQILTDRDNRVLGKRGNIITIVAPVNDPRVTFFIVKPDSQQLEKLANMAINAKLLGHVDGVYALPDGQEAMEKVESKRGMGKVVLRVSGENGRPKD